MKTYANKNPNSGWHKFEAKFAHGLDAVITALGCGYCPALAKTCLIDLAAEGEAFGEPHAANFRSRGSVGAGDVANRARPAAQVRSALIGSAMVLDNGTKSVSAQAMSNLVEADIVVTRFTLLSPDVEVFESP